MFWSHISWKVLHNEDTAIFLDEIQDFLSFKLENGRISAPEPQIKKIRVLYFLQLLKLQKAKCLYFFCLWPRSRDMAIFLVL